MTALGIGVTDRDPVTVHDFRPGRSNLLGQQVSSRLALANEQCDMAWRQYCQAIDDCEDGKVDRGTVAAFERIYNIAEAWRKFILASDGYVESISRLLDGEITFEEQAVAWTNYCDAGVAFRNMNFNHNNPFEKEVNHGFIVEPKAEFTRQKAIVG